MQSQLTGFSYYIDNVLQKDAETFHKKIEKLDIKETTVDSKKLIVNARTV